MCIFISRHQESSTMFRAFIRICWSSQTNHVFTTQGEVGAELRVSVLGPLTLVWMTFLCSLQVMEWGYWQWTMLIHSLGILHLIISRRATSRPAPYQHHLRPQTPRREMSVHWVICEWTLVVHPELWLFSSWSWMFLVQSLYSFTPECSSLHFISFSKASQGPSIPDALKNYSWSIFGRDYVPETSTSHQVSRHKVHRDWRLLLGRHILNLSLVHQLLWFSYDLLFGVMCR